MNVMFFAYDSNYSGSTLSMIKLILELRKYNINSVLVFTKVGDAIELVEKENIKYYIIPEYSWTIPIKSNIIDITKLNLKRILNFFQKGRIKKIIKKNNIDIIHINNAYLYYPCIIGHEMNIKVVWHLREFMEEDQGYKIWNEKEAKKVFNMATKIIAISDSILNKYSKYLEDKTKITKIYNGIDVYDFYYNVDHAFKNDVVKIMLPATLMKEKGQHELLYAAKSVIESGIKNIEVIFAGRNVSNEYYSYLEELIEELKLNNYVKYIGFTKNVNQIMKNVDIVCVCSKLEAFGRTTIEAMLSNCLVIGADSGGTSELIKNGVNGFLYEQDNYNDLANKIINSIKNKDEMIKIINCGRESAKKEFSSFENAKNVYNLYNSIINKGENNESN